MSLSPSWLPSWGNDCFSAMCCEAVGRFPVLPRISSCSDRNGKASCATRFYSTPFTGGRKAAPILSLLS